MLNNKGYTLVELLATMIVLGIIMAVTIPNISGISTQNKITAYAEDAKKLKNTVEYLLRGDDAVIKPEEDNCCVMVNLGYVHSNDFDETPYGGSYDVDNSFVVMVKRYRRYEYYVQLVEKFTAERTDNYKGFSLINYTELEGSNYLNHLTEGVNMNPFIRVSSWAESERANVHYTSRRTEPDYATIGGITGCSEVKALYYANV